MSINVNRNNPDQFYRYKMPRLIAKVEGKGNGIKTVIVNMTDIAKALSRPPTYPTKYFGCELGAQTQFDVKNERYIVNGAHDAAKLQDLLDGFIRKFVLCRECDNPETSLAVNIKKQTIAQRCIACGYQCQLGTNHKLTTFILKYPPDAPDHAGDTGAKKEGDKRNGTSKKKTKGSTGSDEDTSKTTADTGVNAQEQSAAIRSGDHVISAPAAVKTTGASDDDDDWCEDTSEEAQRRRMKELSEGAAQLTMSADLQKTPQERVDMFYVFVKARKEKNSGLAAFEKEISAEADRLDVKDKAPLVLAELLFTQNIVKEIKDNHRLLLRFTASNEKAQKYLLGAFEKIVGDLYREALMPKVPLILKTMYDLDLVDEPVFFDWHSKVSKKYVKKSVSQEIHSHAAPFIKWLKEAEEESDESDGGGDSNAKSEEDAEDSEEEEDDGLEVAFSSTEKIGTKVVKAAVLNGTAPAGEEEDINIDDI